MRINEIKEREDLDVILRKTLEAEWTRTQGHQVHVRMTDSSAGQTWREQPLLSAYYVRGVESEVRRYLADSFRYTTVKARMLPQWLLGTALASKPGLRWSSKPVFRVTPQIEYAEKKLIVPGNQRIRIFDFDAGRITVVLKHGFDSETMQREIAVRNGDNAEHFVKVIEADDRGRWMEEPFVDGFPLSRCPPWHNRLELERRAFECLAKWQRRYCRTVSAADYATFADQGFRRIVVDVDGTPATRLNPRVD